LPRLDHPQTGIKTIAVGSAAETGRVHCALKNLAGAQALPFRTGNTFARRGALPAVLDSHLIFGADIKLNVQLSLRRRAKALPLDHSTTSSFVGSTEAAAFES
jgi:hypothetical protein